MVRTLAAKVIFFVVDRYFKSQFDALLRTTAI